MDLCPQGEEEKKYLKVSMCVKMSSLDIFHLSYRSDEVFTFLDIQL